MYWGRREAKFPTDERIKQMVSFNLFNLLGMSLICWESTGTCWESMGSCCGQT